MAEIPKLPDVVDGAQFASWRAGAGIDSFYRGLEPLVRLPKLAWLDGCPNPGGVSEACGFDWTLARYQDCNYWGGCIVETLMERNLELAKKLLTPVLRPESQPARGYDPEFIPASYLTTIHPGSTPWGYALSRVLIEQMGRDEKGISNWKIGEERVSTGLRCLESAIAESGTPAELVAGLAARVVEADAKPTAVLGHVLAIELKEEGMLFLMGGVVEALVDKAPEVWQAYLKMTPEGRKQAGMIGLFDLLHHGNAEVVPGEVAVGQEYRHCQGGRYLTERLVRAVAEEVGEDELGDNIFWDATGYEKTKQVRRVRVVEIPADQPAERARDYVIYIQKEQGIAFPAETVWLRLQSDFTGQARMDDGSKVPVFEKAA